MHKKLLFIALTWLCAISSMADTLTIVSRFEKIEHASVLASYRNEFGSYRKPNMDVEFPYALIRVHIEGNESAVTKAKERFALYLGQHYTTKAKNTSRVNEIMFLVPVGAGHVELQCGDGCRPLVLFDYTQLAADAIYEGKVRYALEKQEPVQSTTTQAPKRQFFKFRVSPADAIVEVAEEGNVFKPWQLQDGIASDMLDWGTYRFRISANRYHAEEGTITVSDTQTEKTVTLQPKFGWLSITGGQNEQGAMVYATSAATQEKIQLGTIPVESKELMAGTYTIEVLRDQYHTFTTSVVVAEGKKAATTVQLIPTFGWLSITGDVTSKGAFVYVTNQKTKERMQWGTIPVAQKSLTAGEYVIDIYKDKYKDYSTTITIAENKSHTQSPSLISNYSQIALQTNTDAEIWLDNKRLGTGRWTGTLEIGKYVIETRLASHKSAYTNVEITTSSTGKTFTLNAPIPMYSTLIINGSPADATVYVDGNRVGVSPLVVNDMLVGEHTVRVTKSGYQKQELKVNLQENKEQTVKYSLKKGVVLPAKPFPTDPVTIGDLKFSRYYGGDESMVEVDDVVDENRVTDVVIPETITWEGCEYSVVAIDYCAFLSCSALESIKLPESIIEIGSQAFCYCSKLKSIVIPNGVKVIDYKTFGGCSALESVVLPDSLASIGSWVFEGCSSLKSITIPQNVNDIDRYVFADSSLKSVVWNLTSDSWQSKDAASPFRFNETITSITFGEGVEYIGEDFCSGMKSLESVTLPASLKTIGASTFDRCYKLKRVNYMGDIASWCNIEFRYLSSNPLSRWTHLYIDNKEVTDLVIPEGVKEIKDYAFSYGKYITSVTLPQSLTHIGSYAFYDCGMTSVVIPENVCTIENDAFPNLQSVTLGRGVKSIGYHAFGNPKNKKLRIYVPAGMKKEYSKRNGFKEYKSKIKEIKE